jgi:hypothetical protein
MRPVGFAVLALLVQGGTAAIAQQPTAAATIALELPHRLGAGDTAWIEVRVGPLGGGQEIAVATASGRELGVISPFGIRAGQDAGTYTLPVPADAFRDGRVSIRLTITQFGNTRAPTTDEVRGVSLKVVRAPR